MVGTPCSVKRAFEFIYSISPFLPLACRIDRLKLPVKQGGSRWRLSTRVAGDVVGFKPRKDVIESRVCHGVLPKDRKKVDFTRWRR